MPAARTRSCRLSELRTNNHALSRFVAVAFERKDTTVVRPCLVQTDGAIQLLRVSRASAAFSICCVNAFFVCSVCACLFFALSLCQELPIIERHTYLDTSVRIVDILIDIPKYPYSFVQCHISFFFRLGMLSAGNDSPSLFGAMSDQRAPSLPFPFLSFPCPSALFESGWAKEGRCSAVLDSKHQAGNSTTADVTIILYLPSMIDDIISPRFARNPSQAENTKYVAHTTCDDAMPYAMDF